MRFSLLTKKTTHFVVKLLDFGFDKGFDLFLIFTKSGCEIEWVVIFESGTKTSEHGFGFTIGSWELSY